MDFDNDDDTFVVTAEEISNLDESCLRIDKPVSYNAPTNLQNHCILCSKSNTSLNGVTLLEEFQKIEDSLLGKVADMFIFETMKKYYDEKIKQPMLRQDINCPDIDVDMIAKHFCYHSINPKRMLKNDILFLNNAQSFLRQNGLLKENIASGTKSLNNGFMKQWNQISKTKIDLMRYYNQLSKEDMLHKRPSTNPQEFSKDF